MYDVGPCMLFQNHINLTFMALTNLIVEVLEASPLPLWICICPQSLNCLLDCRSWLGKDQ